MRLRAVLFPSLRGFKWRPGRRGGTRRQKSHLSGFSGRGRRPGVFIFRGASVEATCLASEPGSAASTWGAWGWWSTRFVLCFPICKMRMLRVFTSQGSHIACKVLGVASDTYEGLSSGSLLTRPSFLGAGSCCLRDGGWVRLRVLALLNCRPSEYSSALVIGRMKLGCGVSTQRREGKIRQTGHRRSETWAKCFQEKLPWNKTSHTGSGHRLMIRKQLKEPK